MRDFQLDNVGGRPRNDEERLAEIETMPEEKIVRLYSCAHVSKVKCNNCGEPTWLIGASGHNSRDSCHNCGEEYGVVG